MAKYKHVARDLAIATGVEVASAVGFVAVASTQATTPNPPVGLIASELGAASILTTLALFTGIGSLAALILRNN